MPTAPSIAFHLLLQKFPTFNHCSDFIDLIARRLGQTLQVQFQSPFLARALTHHCIIILLCSCKYMNIFS